MNETTRQGFLGRTGTLIRRAWRDAVRGSAATPLSGSVRQNLPDDDIARLRAQIEACLRGIGGAASARARAADLGRAYLELNEEGRLRFFRTLAELQPPKNDGVDDLIADLKAAEGPADAAEAADRLRRALQSPRIRLLRQFNGLAAGVKFLVDLRADLRETAREDPSLRFLDTELRDLLSSWFDVGFLELRRITWHAPAAVLEKLIDYEAVHQIRSWGDLKHRLEPGRRAYAFFHPNMPDEPLIFVEVALVRGMADSVQALLDETAPREHETEADTAIFYSISNAQRGLDGVSLGDFLIKQVADSLGHDLPNVRTFATLSPIPGFRAWLDRACLDRPDLLLPGEAAVLAEFDGELDAGRALQQQLGDPRWPDDEARGKALRPILTRLCARYLLQEKRADGRALDPVAHFHLGNGARVERINWLGDRSGKGMAQSWGMMVNYRYVLGDVETNHEAYRGQGEVRASRAVRGLV